MEHTPPIKAPAIVSPDTDAGKPSSLLVKALTIAAYPVTIGAGWLLGHTYLRNSVYDTLKHTPLLESERVVEHFGRLNGVVANAKNIIKPLSEEHKRYAEVVKRIFREHNLNNTWDFFKASSRGERLQGTIHAFTAAGIAAVTMGVLINIAENKSLMYLFSTKDKSKDKTPLGL